MKKLIEIRHLICLFLIVTGVTILQSCAVYQPYNANLVTVPEIIQMSKDGVSSKDIIKDIRKSHTAYRLKADQLANLRDQGVQDSVINYMEKTHMDYIRGNQQMEDSYYWWPGGDGYFYGGLGFGWPYYGYWGWGWGPTIIYSGHRSFGGEFHGGFHGNIGFHGGTRR
jgi:hypothetical protein